MVFDVLKVKEISGIGDFEVKADEVDKPGVPKLVRQLFMKGDKAFLVENLNTIEVRTDEKLRQLLKEKYESVMGSRYFGRGGIEIVLAGQLSEDEIVDLIRLSYNLT